MFYEDSKGTMYLCDEEQSKKQWFMRTISEGKETWIPIRKEPQEAILIFA